MSEPGPGPVSTHIYCSSAGRQGLHRLAPGPGVCVSSLFRSASHPLPTDDVMYRSAGRLVSVSGARGRAGDGVRWRQIREMSNMIVVTLNLEKSLVIRLLFHANVCHFRESHRGLRDFDPPDSGGGRHIASD